MNLDDTSTTEPIPFDDYDYYAITDLDYDDSLPPFKMSAESSKLNPRRYNKMMNILYPSQENDSDDEEEVESEKPKYGSLDVISLNHLNHSKLDWMSQMYIGSLTMVGLYVLFRYYRK